MMEYRWLTPEEMDDVLNPALKIQGYAELNVNPQQVGSGNVTLLCRVLGAYWDGELVEAFAFQMYPMLGPLIKVNNSFRDDGTTARALAARMAEFFEEVQARAALCIADTPMTERFCERFGMTKISQPVFSFVRKEANAHQSRPDHG
jgi:hypothetical protein